MPAAFIQAGFTGVFISDRCLAMLVREASCKQFVEHRYDEDDQVRSLYNIPMSTLDPKSWIYSAIY